MDITKWLPEGMGAIVNKSLVQALVVGKTKEGKYCVSIVMIGLTPTTRPVETEAEAVAMRDEIAFEAGLK